MRKDVDGYSATQIGLHWAVVAVVAFQFVASRGMETAWRALFRGESLDANTAILANFHVAAGLLVFGMMLARFYLRLSHGVPSPPVDEPRILQWFAEATHWAIYGLLMLLPLSGMVAWFATVRPAGDVHELLGNLLLGAIALHVSGALFQHFIRRSDVVIRILRPGRSAGPSRAQGTGRNDHP